MTETRIWKGTPKSKIVTRLHNLFEICSGMEEQNSCIRGALEPRNVLTCTIELSSDSEVGNCVGRVKNRDSYTHSRPTVDTFVRVE